MELIIFSSCMSDVESNNSEQAIENINPNVPVQRRKRALQQVCTKQERKIVVDWMIEDASLREEAYVISRAVRQFPNYFHSANVKANLQRASRWWRARDNIVQSDRGISGCKVVIGVQLGSLVRRPTKARKGRGRKRSRWVSWLYEALLVEFERLKKAGVTFSLAILQEVAMEILNSPGSAFDMQYRDPRDGHLISAKINKRWMQCFMDANNIVLFRQTGRMVCSPEKELQIEMFTAYHLGELYRGFVSGLYHEDYIENIDETHFVINFQNGRTLGFRGDVEKKYADVVNGGEAMTMVVRITGGRRGKLEVPMMIFSNPNRSYPIRGVEDNVPGVSYRSAPKGWMDKSIFAEYFSDQRSYQGDAHGHMKHVFVDNCSSHIGSERLTQVLSSKNTKLGYLPPCTTHLCQPVDTFVISKIKDAWRSQWEKKLELIQHRLWQNEVRTDGAWSGKLHNPGKKFFLALAASSVNDVNRQVDSHGMS
jgi:hypothetical protein